VEAIEGTATADSSGYAGSEDWSFTDEDTGDDLCRIRYDLTSTATRTDCKLCSWAFDLTKGNAAIVAESGPGCLELSGYDKGSVSSLDGEVVSYGYVAEYLGHSNVLQMDVNGSWVTVSFASWDSSTKEFSYQDDLSFFNY